MKFVSILLLCILLAKSILCDGEEEVKTDEAAEEGFDAYNVTMEEKTPEEVKKEEECFAKVFEGKDMKVIHDEEEERKFACHAEDKVALIAKYEDVKKCMAMDDAWRLKHRGDMRRCMKDNTEEMRAMQDVALDFIERWCQKEEGPMNFMKGYVACREETITPEVHKREESCFQKHFGTEVSLKALHEEEAERKFACDYKDKRQLLKKHHLIWACVKPSPEEMKAYKHDFKACMDKKGLKFGGE